MTDEAPQEADGQATDSAPEAVGQAQQPEGQATEQAAWYDSAPDEIKGYIKNKGWDDPIKAVTSYKELEKFNGANENELIKLPKDMSEEGALDPVYDKLGRPESPEKYEIDLGEDVQIDENRLNTFKEVAHKLGLNNKQVQELAQVDAAYYQEAMNKAQEEINQKHAAELNKLEKEWGNAFEERAELGRRFIKQNMPDDVDKEQMLNSIENAIGPRAMLKLFAGAGEKSSPREDRLPDSNGDRPFGYSPEQALADKQKLMSEIQADPKRLANYNNGIGPDYSEMKRLLEISAGGK